MKSRQILVALAVAVAAALALGAGLYFMADRTDAPAAQRALRPADASTLAVGERVYATHCASCHGARLEGQANWQSPGTDGLLPAPPHDAGGHTWHHPDDLLFRITKFGVAKAANLSGHRSAMPAYEGILSDEEIVAVLSWIKSRWPASIRAKHDQINELSAASRNR